MSEKQRTSYRQLVEQYATLLNAWLAATEATDAEAPNLPSLASPWAFAPCPFVSASDEGLAHLLIGPGERPTGLRVLRDFTAGATRLIIIDPHFFGGHASSAEAYASEVAKTARFDQIRELHVVYNHRCVTKKVLAKVKANAKARGVRVSLCDTETVHDRVWIADGNRAVAVGTSLNGLGSRAAFILPLPPEDLAYIQEFMRAHELDPHAAA